MIKKYSVFGSFGFIGSEICKDKDFIHAEVDKYDKNRFVSPTKDLVYLISTTDNYNVIDNNPYVDIKTNLLHLMTVLQANRMKYGDNFTITFVSSWFVYGKTECPAKETSTCYPTGFYSITKMAAEQLLISYCDTFGIKWKIVRLSNVLGSGDKKASKRKNALQYMIKTLCNGGTVDLYRGRFFRDYIHVFDAAEAIRSVAKRGHWWNVYNAGSGEGHAICDLVNYAQREVGGNINIIPVPEFHKQVQVDNMWMDVNKIRRDTGWFSKLYIYDIIDGLISDFTHENN